MRYKLIRIKIPAQAKDSGEPIFTRRVVDGELTNYLFEKMTEELAELVAAHRLANKSRLIEEAADLIEVFGALIQDLGIDLLEMHEQRLAKRQSHGPFTEGHAGIIAAIYESGKLIKMSQL